jgi:hypothetical protein
MLAAGLVLSVLLPLLAGSPWLLLAQRENAPGGLPVAIAYGYVLGLLIIVGGMKVLSLANVPIGLLSASALPIVIGAIGWWRGSRFANSVIRTALRSAQSTWRQMPRATRIAVIVAIALIAVRLATLAVESMSRPMFPWEAVSSVAAKARVWYEFGTIVLFVQPVDLLQGLGSFTDADPGAFGLPSLLLVWTAIALGRWHEGAVSLPWLMLGIALALAFYGHLRRAGCGIAYSLVFTYLLISIPLVDMHIALSGAPQWIAAVGVGLASCAVLRWLNPATRTHELLVCAAIGAILASCTLPTTWPWLGILAIAGAIQRWPRLAGKLSVGIPLVILIALLALMQTPATIGGRLFQVRLAAEWSETPESLLLLDNWHLLFGILLLIAIAGWRRMFTPSWRAQTWIVGMGLGLMIVKGVLSLPPNWFGGLRDFSYAGLQLAPVMLMWIALLAHDIATEERSPEPSQPPGDSEVPPAGEPRRVTP